MTGPFVTYKPEPGIEILLECSGAYAQASRSMRDSFCNGCGPESLKALRTRRLLDYLLGASVGEPDGPCCVHDWDYSEGIEEHERVAADARFWRNLCVVVQAYGGPWWLRRARRLAAWAYWRALVWGGRAAFEASKKII